MIRKSISTLFLLLSLSPLSGAFAQNGSEAAIKARMEGITAAWGTMETAKIKPYYTTDPNAVIFDLSPLEYRGAGPYIAGSQKEFAQYKSQTLTIRHDAQVHVVAPDSAWATATVDVLLVHKDDKRETLTVRWTSIWQKSGANWIIVHEHWSAPLPN
jgi:ketosteroid isomerase-like protein